MANPKASRRKTVRKRVMDVDNKNKHGLTAGAAQDLGDQELQSEERKKLVNILVVGDWVIDDHWVTGIHRSPTASRTGRKHHRSLHKPDSTVRSLCGAGRTASILHQAEKGSEELFNVLGLGLWHPEDTNDFERMLDPKSNSGATPFKITSQPLPDLPRSHLFNIAEARESGQHSGARTSKYGTTRMIRIYQDTGAQIELLERIDWELPTPYHKKKEEPAWVETTRMLKEFRKLNEALVKYPVDAVVIKDLRKGVTCDAVVEWLVDKFREKPWFVSTKAWRPVWLWRLASVNLRMLVVPEVPAESAIRADELCRWITESGHPSNEAMKLMDELYEKCGKPGAPSTVVVLPRGLSVLARHQYEDGSVSGITQVDVDPVPLDVNVAMASVLLPAMVTNLLSDEGTEIEVVLKQSLGFTHRWMAREASRFRIPEGESQYKEARLRLDQEMQEVGTWEPFKWEEDKQKWRDALKECGLIVEPRKKEQSSWEEDEQEGKSTPEERGATEEATKKERLNQEEDEQEAKRAPEERGAIEEATKKRIELWRSMTDLKGYVCCVDSKRKVIRELSRELDRFRRGDRRHHTSCLIIAPPGSGKTHLVRQLARSFKMRFLPFNITQMISRNDILDCFDIIATTQTQAREEPVLVFIDEIDAEIGGQAVYDAFLAPLQEGAYLRQGKTFRIDPCVWVFAGTEQPRGGGAGAGAKTKKASDFESRLSIEPLNLEPEQEEEVVRQQVRLEMVYLGVSLIRRSFPDVREVSEKVFHLFHDLPSGFRMRELDHLVKSFFSVQHGQVDSRNVPIDRLKRVKHFSLRDWQGKEEGVYVQIVS